jgi:uncharacterized lipoprotein YddW (UPF0748 family)
MRNLLLRISFLTLVSFLILNCRKDEIDVPDKEDPNRPYDPVKDEIAIAKKEIRAAWIATVSNLDWPNTKGDANTQKAELQAHLNRCQLFNFNAVILQIRPMADAFYPSSLEPWSVYLTGTQGQDPGYDPLRFAVDESHKRGMELHAWLNPYRIGSTSAVLAPNHPAVKNPSWVVVYNNTRYYNPGMPEVRAHLVAVVKDIVSRYDVDAIHFDDYFYPDGAKSTVNPFGFNDQDAYSKYGGGKDIHTWRTDNVNQMVMEISQAIKNIKPGVLFGISPAGRRENSLNLYADPFIWMDNKWIDYLAPQIYWEYGHSVADFGIVSSFWNSNAKGIPMIIGMAAYKFKDPAYPAFTVTEFDRQVETVRNSAYLNGCFWFRMKSLENVELHNFLKDKYKYKSALPVMGRSTVPNPETPVPAPNGKILTWNKSANAVQFVVYQLTKDSKVNNRFNANAVQITTELQYTGESGKSYFITSLNSDNVESTRSVIVTLK